MRAVRRKPTRGWWLVGVTALAGLTTVNAQQVQSVSPPAGQSGGERRSFEVASVKPNTSSDGRVVMGFQPGGRYSATNMPLRFIVRSAFRVQDPQLIGMPEWTQSERFDIVAKAEDPNATPEMIWDMLQSLLAERFQLASHRETRELPVYDLVLARSDGKLGPDLKPSTTDCEAMRARGRGAAPEGGRMTMPIGRGGPPPGAPEARGGALGAVPPCMMRMAPGNLAASGTSLNQLAQSLEAPAGRIVRNKTGLTGGYDFNVTFAPQQMAGGGRGVDVPVAGDPGAAPSLFTALQEQLGLKLESVRAPIDVVVVDKIERPTPD